MITLDSRSGYISKTSIKQFLQVQLNVQVSFRKGDSSQKRIIKPLLHLTLAITKAYQDASLLIKPRAHSHLLLQNPADQFDVHPPQPPNFFSIISSNRVLFLGGALPSNAPCCGCLQQPPWGRAQAAAPRGAVGIQRPGRGVRTQGFMNGSSDKCKS